MTTKRCDACKRTEMYFDGCSHVVCPQRKTLTAAPVGEPFEARPKGTLHVLRTGSEGSYINPSRIKGEE